MYILKPVLCGVFFFWGGGYFGVKLAHNVQKVVNIGL